LGSGAWNVARTGSLESYGLYRNFVLAQQELPTRQAVFVYATWQDLILRSDGSNLAAGVDYFY